MGSATSWEKTELWQELSRRDTPEAENVGTTLRRWMPEISRILASGGTAPLDFTLHDAEHAIRVAGRMSEIVPSDVLPALSEYELALLLFAAFLHDVGMTPERGKVLAHRKYLLDGESGSLGEEERAEFQRWLDGSGYGVVPPLAPSRSLDETVRFADEIITYYARHKHNDWSEQWIRDHLASEPLGTYSGWMEDLVALCRSHHEGYDVLAGSRFNPRPVGSLPRIVNLRYLAAVLRVADILDLDPERTPESVLHHREIDPKSLIYWHKDHEITLSIHEGRVAMYARPSRAFVHKALADTADQIEAELVLCRRLDDTLHFARGSGPVRKLPHQWELQPYVFRDIQPREGTYQYIDGAFRPNTRRILELLSGTQLYGNPFAAVRELLQNGFDAVREKIAYERLRQPDPANPELEQLLGNLHTVELRVEQESDGLWLVCSDDGIGMTKAIITDQFLISGAARPRQILELERRCAERGFVLGRTGQFGIGALSYFMLGDHVSIHTRRATDAGDSELNGWRFDSDGVGAFGELRRDNRLVSGTEVRLRLRSEIVSPDLEQWTIALRDFITSTLGRIPCRFVFNDAAGGRALLEYSPGWTRDREFWSMAATGNLEWRKPHIPDELLSPDRRSRHETERLTVEQYRSEVVSAVDWKVIEEELPDGLGRYRLHVPYFRMACGEAVVFLRAECSDGEIHLFPVSDGLFYRPRSRVLTYWKGIAVDLQHKASNHSPSDLLGPRYGTSVEVDLLSADAGMVSVNRQTLTISPAVADALELVEKRVRASLASLLAELRDSPFAHLNYCVVDADFDPAVPVLWSAPGSRREGEEEDTTRWARLTFPRSTHLEAIDNRGREIPGSPPLYEVDLDYSQPSSATWYSGLSHADRLVVNRSFFQEESALVPVLIWDTAPRLPGGGEMIARFPPEWDHVLGMDPGLESSEFTEVIWNANHPAVQAVVARGWNADRDWQENPIPIREALLGDRAKAAAWLMKFANYGRMEVWEGLCNNHPAFLEDLWSLVFQEHARHLDGEWLQLCFVKVGFDFEELSLLSPRTGFFTEEREIMDQRLPAPSEDWLYEVSGEFPV